MDESKKPVKTGINYTIGKKTYTQEDIQRIKSGVKPEMHHQINPEIHHNAAVRPESGHTIKTTISQPPAAAIHTGKQYTPVKSNLKVQSAAEASAAAESRVYQQTAAYTDTGNVITGPTITTNVSTRAAVLSNLRNKPVDAKVFSGGSGIIPGQQIAGRVQGALGATNDLGGQAASGIIAAGRITYTAFRGSQTAATMLLHTPQAAQTMIKAGKGTWDVATTAGRVTLTVTRTAGALYTAQFVPVNMSALQTLQYQAQTAKLGQTVLSQKIIKQVQTIQTRVQNVQSTVKAVRTTGITADMAKNVAQRVGKSAAMGAAKTGQLAATKGVPKVAKIVKGGIVSTSNAITQGQEDYAVQGIGHAVNAANYAVKTGVVGVKATKHAVKTSVKAGKTVWRTASFVKNNGLKAAAKHAGSKARGAAVQAGKSAVSAVIKLVQMAGKKLVLPLILLCCVVLGATGVISTPIMAIGSIFGSSFSTADTEIDYDIRDYIMDQSQGLPSMREVYIHDLVSYLQNSRKANGGNYHYVRLYTNQDSGVIDTTYSGVAGVFYSAEDLGNIVQPIFNAVILMDYELEPTETQALSDLQTMFDQLFTRENVTSIEYCGQSAIDGSGTPDRHYCSHIHAHGDCPNPVSGTHSSYTCDDCCYWYCPGHSDGDGGTYYCGGCRHACSGYVDCGGHNILSVTLIMDGLYKLMADYFTDPIDNLANLASRTEEQEEQLENLRDYYEICLEYVSLVAAEYGGGLTMADLSGVQWINGSRVGNQAVIDLALSQVGQVGGQPYWSHYGFRSRVAWCACFVQWAMDQTGNTSLYATSSNNAYVPTLAKWFSDNGRFADNSFRDLVPGDCIIFDWEPGTGPDHIGLVVGRDDTYVYTVEGNSGDSVRVKQYRLDSSVIYGYGLMNYAASINSFSALLAA